MLSHGAQRTGFLYGVAAGLALVAALWGPDAWALYRAQALLPWAKLALAVVCLLPTLGLIGWLSIRSQSTLLSALAWVLAGLVVGWFAAEVAFRLFPWAAARSAPDLAGDIAYGYGVGPQTRAVLASAACGILFLAGGLMLVNLVEAAGQSVYLAGRAFPLVLWASLFALSGGLVDSLVQRPLRLPVAALDRLIDFRLSDPLGLQREQVKLLRANVLNPVKDLLPRPRRLVVASYDDLLVQIQVLVDFEGDRVQCTLVDNKPVYCEQLE